MSLAIEVGILSQLSQSDPEEVPRWRTVFERINDVLREQGFPEHYEPDVLPEYTFRNEVVSFPYNALHCLRGITKGVGCLFACTQPRAE